MDRGADEDPLAARRPAGHQGGLGRRRGAVVVGGADDVEVDELGEERLVLVDALERALADLRLVRRVGRVPLAAEEDLVDRRRATSGDRRRRPRNDARSVRFRPASALEAGGELQLRLRARAGPGGSPGAPRGCRRRARRRSSMPERREHPLAVAGGVRTVGHRLSRRRSARRRPTRRGARPPRPGSASRMRTIQPSPYGSLLTSSGDPVRASFVGRDLAGQRGEQVADGLDGLDDAEGRELGQGAAGARAARRRRCRRAGRPRRP